MIINVPMSVYVALCGSLPILFYLAYDVANWLTNENKVLSVILSLCLCVTFVGMVMIILNK